MKIKIRIVINVKNVLENFDVSLKGFLNKLVHKQLFNVYM